MPVGVFNRLTASDSVILWAFIMGTPVGRIIIGSNQQKALKFLGILVNLLVINS
jgi:hypothetical protein